MADLVLSDLRKTYPGGVEAVRGVSIAVPDRELCVLVGPSGCGKSTLLRMVAGLETITQGTVAIGGKVVNNLGPAERDIAMVFQNYALYPHMKVYDNMAYGLRNRGTPKSDIDRRVRDAAAKLGLAELLDRRPRELSGGQRQRVAMARAIVRNPKAFLFDEPLSNLDAKLRTHMRVEIKRIQRSYGVTSLYVTHDQVEAMTLADVLVVMNGGVAEQVGPPMDVYERPASLFVAGFIGSPAMNLVPLDDMTSSWLDPAGRPPGAALVAGIRPENLQHADGRPATFDLRVLAVETLGADLLAHGVRQGSSSPRDTIVARLPGRLKVSVDDIVPLLADKSDLHWFDAISGRRVEGIPAVQ